MSLVAANEAPETQKFRSQVGHISRHSGVFFVGTIFTAGFGYLFKVYLARVLGAETLGVYALGLTMVGFAGLLNSLGLTESAVRFAADYRATGKLESLRALLFRGGAILLIANVVFFFAFLAAGKPLALRFYHSSALGGYVPWFAGIMLLGVITSFYGKILAGYRAVGQRTLINNFIGTPATILFSVLLISLRYGLRGYLMAQIVSAIVVLTLLGATIWRDTPLEARHLRPFPQRLEPAVWSFSLAAIANLLLEFLLAHFDKVALGFYLGAAKVGVYSVAAGMVAYESLVLTSVNQVFSPMIADLHARHDLAMLGRLYRALTKWVLGITLPLTITVIVFARPLMRIFGNDFEAGWPILIIGTAGQLVNCAVGSVGVLLWMSGNQRVLLRVQAAMAAFMVIANVALIPVWGIVGAAVAAAVTNVGTNALNLIAVRKVLGLSPFSRSMAGLVPSAFACAVLAILVFRESGRIGHNWLAIVMALLAAYGAFAITTVAFGLDADDRLVLGAIRSRLTRS